MPCVVLPWVYPVWDFLDFLDLGGYFLPHFREIFNYYLLKYFLRPFFLSSSSGPPVIWMLGSLTLCQRSLRFPHFFFNSFFLFFLSASFISTILSSTSLILSSASVILLLVPSKVLLISVIALFNIFWLFFDFFYILVKDFLHLLIPCLQSIYLSVQFSSVAQSCPTLCDPMNCSMPSLPVHHQLLEFTQTHIHRVDDAIQPPHPLSSPFPPAPNPSQHQSLFQWVTLRMRWPKYWSVSLSIIPSKEHPELISFRMDRLDVLAVQGTLRSLLQQDWKRSVFISIPKKGNAKECSNYHTIALVSHASKVMFKIIQARFQQYVNHELPDVQAGLKKAEEPETKLPTSAGSSKKQESSRKKHLFLLYWLCQSLWLCGSQ